MTAPLTPRERVEAAKDLASNFIYGSEVVSVDVASQLAAELEEANRRAEKWAKDAGRYAANADFWRKRAEAAERQLAEAESNLEDSRVIAKDWFEKAETLSGQLAAKTAELEELQKKCDQLTGMKFSDRMHAALVSRAEAAEQERDAIHAGELAAMEGCDDIPNDYTPNGKLAWLVGSYKTKLHAAEHQLARYREKYGELK